MSKQQQLDAPFRVMCELLMTMAGSGVNGRGERREREGHRSHMKLTVNPSTREEKGDFNGAPIK